MDRILHCILAYYLMGDKIGHIYNITQSEIWPLCAVSFQHLSSFGKPDDMPNIGVILAEYIIHIVIHTLVMSVRIYVSDEI